MSKPLLMVTEPIRGAHPLHPDYPLYPGDVLTKAPDGRYQKHTGLGMWGFVLTPDQELTLKQVEGQIVMDGGI